MSLSIFFSKQARKPEGLFGRFFMSPFLERGNSNMNNFVKELLAIQDNDRVLEIGFGPGRLTKEIADQLNCGFVKGIDISESMLLVAQKKNKSHIQQGKVSLQLGDFDKIIFEPNSFNKICSVNTVYFWPEPVATAKKILNLLALEGKVFLAFQDKKQMESQFLSNEIFSLYQESEVRDLLLKAGFSRVEINYRKFGSSTYICVIGTK